MLRPQKLAKGPLKAFKGKGENDTIWGGIAWPSVLIIISDTIQNEIQSPLNSLTIHATITKLSAQGL